MNECGFIDIPDTLVGYGKSLFCVPSHYEDSIDGVLIPNGLIHDRIKKMARDILKDVLDEDANSIDPTKNICLDAESLTLTKEEEEKTILDLLSDEKESFDDLINISEAASPFDNQKQSVITKNTTLIPTIHVKSFAKQSIKKESLHFLCIIKVQSRQLEVLRKINYPTVKGTELPLF